MVNGQHKKSAPNVQPPNKTWDRLLAVPFFVYNRRNPDMVQASILKTDHIYTVAITHDKQVLTVGVLQTYNDALEWANQTLALIRDNPDNWEGKEPPDMKDKSN